MKYPWRILGHEAILERLENDLEESRIAHAYLFCGPREIGKFNVAKTFAMLLQCQQGNLCRNCNSCLRIEKNIHPSTTIVDQLWIKDKQEDLEKLATSSNFDQNHRKKSGKKSDQIGIDDVLVFTDGLWQTTTEAFKICVVRDLERMTEEAMNAFLKILEEPPPKTVFLLTATHREALLKTLVSRTRVIEMALVPNSTFRETVAADTSSDDELEQILTLSQGRPERFLRFRENPEFLQEQKNLFHEFSTLLQKKDVPTLFGKAEFLAKPEQEEAMFDFLNGFLHFLRTLLREKTFGKSLWLGSEIPDAKLLELIARSENVQKQISRNVNKRLALESFFLSFL